MKSNEQLHILFKRYLDNTCDLDETQRLMNYFQLGEDKDQLKDLIIDVLNTENGHYETDPAIADMLAKVDVDLFVQIQGIPRVVSGGKESILRPWMRLAAAAATLTIIFTAFYFLSHRSARFSEADKVQAQYKQEIRPGEFGATLTMANGRKINLAGVSKGEIGRESGIVITKTEDGRVVYKINEHGPDANALNTLSTARGETYQVVLPDGSVVYLNAASSLSYSAALLQNGKRVVKLIGEGYFEVTKDKLHPFIVKTNKQEIEVLGTHFNVSSYPDDETEKATLLEGSIKLSASGDTRILKPGQQARLYDGKIQVSDTDTDLAVAWKNNEFVFESESIETIMKMIERWYNVEVIYTGQKTNQRFSGKVSRFDNMSKVLEVVQFTGEAKFEVKGRTVYVSK